MSTWTNRLKRSTGQPLDYSDALDFSDALDGVAAVTAFTNRIKH
jgi:hypothetical protein